MPVETVKEKPFCIMCSKPIFGGGRMTNDGLVHAESESNCYDLYKEDKARLTADHGE